MSLSSCWLVAYSSSSGYFVFSNNNFNIQPTKLTVVMRGVWIDFFFLQRFCNIRNQTQKTPISMLKWDLNKSEQKGQKCIKKKKKWSPWTWMWCIISDKKPRSNLCLGLCPFHWLCCCYSLAGVAFVLLIVTVGWNVCMLQKWNCEYTEP